MRWVAKAALQGGISLLPNADSANLLFQRHVTRNLPRNEASFLQHAEEGIQHLSMLKAHGGGPTEEVSAYEFGAGWDLVGPLSLYCAGVEQQTLLDIRPNVRLDLVEHTRNQLYHHHSRLEQLTGRELRLPGVEPIRNLADVKDRYGIDYLAPRDAATSGLQAESFDLVSSTFTFEHIPAQDIVPILRECARLLRSGGLISCSIDPKDHYSYFDASIGEENFLRFSERTWRLLNPPLQFQNRLRGRDYLTLWEQAGLELVECRQADVSEERLTAVESMVLAPRFTHYSAEELVGRDLHLVGRPT